MSMLHWPDGECLSSWPWATGSPYFRALHLKPKTPFFLFLFFQCLHIRHDNIVHNYFSFFFFFFNVSVLVASVWDIFHQILTPRWQFKHLHPSIPLAHHYIMQAKNFAPASFLSPNTDCHCKMQCVIHYCLYGSKILSYSLDWPSSQ